MPDLSVIVCAHNPRADFLTRTLEGLKGQALAREQWELVLVDNASKVPVAGAWDLAWHPKGRHVREEELGLTHARLRGIRETTGEVLVFVDDDNVLAPDYLQNALEVVRSRPWMGAFGGNIAGDFEVEPEPWMEPALPSLALVSVKVEEWCHMAGTNALRLAPCGAGMVILRKIALYYAEMSAKDALRRGLDRKGTSLTSAGDNDLALCACAMGFAIGRFPQLQMKHILPAGRLKREYLLRLAEEATFSDAILRFIWDKQLPTGHVNNSSRAKKLYHRYRAFRVRQTDPQRGGFNEDLKQARIRGMARAADALKALP